MLKTMRWCLLGLCMAFANAHAAVLLVDGSGQLTGANGVDVGGTLYDVRFVDGTCISLYSDCDSAEDFTLDFAGAGLASQALLDQVFVDGSEGNFDSDPGLTSGCTFVDSCGVITPYAPLFPDNVFVYITVNDGGLDITDGVVQAVLPFDFDTSDHHAFVWAVWTPANQSVPEPSAFACLGVGLLALAVARRRRTLPGCRTQ